CVPLFLTDGLRAYMMALLAHYGHWRQPERRRAKGPLPKPRWMPLPQLLYAQVIKTVRRRRLVRVSHRVVFGTLEAVKEVLAKYGWQSNTSFVERLNLDCRQHIAAVGRRVTTFCKHEAGLRQQLVLYQVYHNFVLPHASLREALAEPEATNGTGSPKQGRPCTLAMAAGLTDHVWTLRTITTEYPFQANRIANRYSEGDRSNAPIVWPHLSPHGDHDQATSGACLCRVALPRDRTYYSLRCYEPE